jgi:hypothetical protein
MVCRLNILVALVLTVQFANAGENVAEEAREWFIAEYAPLWASMDSVDPTEVKKHWVENFRDHPIDVESRTVENSIEQWQRTIERYLNDGVQDSILLEVKAERINDWAVLLRARWKDDPPISPDDPDFCDAYLVGKFEKGWKITNAFTTDCTGH